jgi:hypothetical protein
VEAAAVAVAHMTELAEVELVVIDKLTLFQFQ